ncbi:MAG: DUF58 domain-containing protein [Planctomycetia bacterium]|nr:DUF58 domain-containing protein [Planctomycetia bacterium]
MDLLLSPAPLLDANRFQLAIRRLADSLGYGTDRSIFRGAGLEYEQSRIYQPGDPVKSIDWRVTARTGRVHVKEYEAPRRIPAWMLVDTSASMTTGSIQPTKYETALCIAGGLALACLDRASPVGCLGVGGSSILARPSLSKLSVMGWLHRLRRYRLDEPTAVGPAADLLEPMLGERSLLFVLSDLHDPQAAEGLARLAQRHDVCALVLRDPAERGLRAGFIRGREAETGRAITTRGGFHPSVAEERLAALAPARIDGLVIDTDRPYAARLRLLLSRRRLLDGGRR